MGALPRQELKRSLSESEVDAEPDMSAKPIFDHALARRPR